MISEVFLFADKSTGDVSYILHGLAGDEANWRKIGPIGFTSAEKAEAAILDPKFLPIGVTTEVVSLKVGAPSFIQAVYNGFPPMNTDVFVLDQIFLPLTHNGAIWVDEVLGSPIWSPLFDEGGEGVGLEWLDRVLELVAARLQMGMEAVQAIGALNASDEDEDDAERSHNLVYQHVSIVVMAEHAQKGARNIGKGGSEPSVPALFCVHTSGMTKLGEPELEIRNVPNRWVRAAGVELFGWAVHLLDHGFDDGDVLQGEAPVVLSIRVSDSTDPQWAAQGIECLRLDVIPAVPSSEKGADSEGCKKVLH